VFSKKRKIASLVSPSAKPGRVRGGGRKDKKIKAAPKRKKKRRFMGNYAFPIALCGKF